MIVLKIWLLLVIGYTILATRVNGGAGCIAAIGVAVVSFPFAFVIAAGVSS